MRVLKRIKDKLHKGVYGSQSIFFIGAFWSFSGSLIARVLTLASTVLIARLLGKDVYGEFGIIQSTIGMFGIFASFGLATTTTIYIAKYKGTDPQKVSNVLSISYYSSCILGIILTLCLFGYSETFSVNSLSAPYLKPVIQISSIYIFFSAVSGIQTGALTGFEKFKTIAYVNLYTGIFSFVSLVLGAYIGGLEGCAWGYVIGVSFNCILNFFILLKLKVEKALPPPKNIKADLNILYKFSLPSFLGGVMILPANWLCNVFLVQHDGFGEMGILNVANQWRMALLFIPSTLSTIILPLLSNLSGTITADNNRFFKIVMTNIKLNILVTALIAIPACFFSKHILEFYGAGFISGYHILNVALLSTIFVSVNNVVGNAIASTGQMWIALVFNFCWAAVLLVCTYFFIENNMGALGITYATLIAYAMHTIWQLIYLRWWKKSL